MRDLTLLTDYYQLTMMQGYFLNNKHEDIAVFDMFYRKNPDGAAFSIFCGLEQFLEYIEEINFDEEKIEYLRSFGAFQESFLEYLKTFKFTGSIKAFREGSVILPNEPIVRVTAPIIECQFIETALLNFVNHQSLIATKALRVCEMAGDASVLEFGLRRAQGADAGIYGARSAYIGGCAGTSNVLAGQKFDIPVSGTHAHSWIMSFDTEYEAFLKYSDIYSENCILLVDTYNTLKSGIVNAVKVFSKMREEGRLPKAYGIRLDSGDLAYLSKKCREILDENGFKDAIISASSDLDEYLISDLKSQGAKIDMYGVGTNLITSKTTPSFGGVYKISAIQDEKGEYINKIKLSNNAEKVTIPGVKKVYRIYNNNKKIKGDLIALEEETFREDEDFTIFDPQASWRRTKLTVGEFKLREMLEDIIIDGKVVLQKRTTKEIRKYCESEIATVWEESLRLSYPQLIFVDLSKNLLELRNNLALNS